MWSPLPRPKVTRRPRPLENFNHTRRKPVKRKNPLEFRPENHYGTRYFGIRHSDITDYLEKQVPSHAFAPANIHTGPPTNHGRGKIGEQVRPSSAPAAIPWFGRKSSDVSDWLRQIPPAHLGLDADNIPLPYFPTKTSIVTDNKWQTRDFPPVPSALWHYWAERPDSAPLPTAPQLVHFDTILDAIKKNRPKPMPNSQSSEREAQSGANTPRSARNNPESRVQTPRVPESPCGAENDRCPCQSRPWPATTGGTNPGTPRPRTPEVKSPETQAHCCQCGKREGGGESSRGNVNGNGFAVCKICSCEIAQDTPRSSSATTQEPSPRCLKRPETPKTADKLGNSNPTSEQCQGNGCNTPMGSAAEPPRPQTLKLGETKTLCASPRPPTCPTTPKQRAHTRNCPKTPPVPFHEVTRNSRKPPNDQNQSEKANGKRNGSGEEATTEEFRLMCPDTYATKVVWQDNFRKHK